MSDWQPNWADVRWDWKSAEDACAALRRMADMLDRRTGDQQRAVGAAYAPSGNELDDELAHAFSSAHRLANDCREAADYITQVSQRAHKEQRRRELERAAGRWEKGAEERRQKA
jgi:hypothetical protein